MIYLDTSVALAQLLAVDRRPSKELWKVPLVSSRLLGYELWNRINARGLAASHGEISRALIARIALVELARPVLERIFEPFPVPVRTLDAFHLATIDFLIRQGQAVHLATFDHRQAEAARALQIDVLPEP